MRGIPIKGHSAGRHGLLRAIAATAAVRGLLHGDLQDAAFRWVGLEKRSSAAEGLHEDILIQREEKYGRKNRLF